MKERHSVLVKKLLSGKVYTIRQLSLYCMVSYKILQADIAEINSFFQKHGIDAAITSKSRQGVYLLCGDPVNLLRILADCEPETPQYHQPIFDERQISFAILSAEDYIRVEDLCDRFLISRSPFLVILKRIKQELHHFHLEIVTRPRYGMYIQGKEESVRKCMTALLANESAENQKIILSDYLTESELIFINETVISLLRKYEFYMESNKLEDLLLQVKIMLIRIRGGHSLSSETESGTNIGSEKEILLAKRLAEELSEKCDLLIKTEECLRLAQLLAAKRQYDTETMRKRMDAQNIDMDAVIKRICGEIEAHFGWSFSEDLELYTSLVQHISSLIDRVRYQTFTSNPVLSDIKVFCPLAFEMAIETARVLSEELDITLDDQETGYFAIYFHLSMDRQNSASCRKKRALVICPAGKAMSKLLVNLIRNQFGDYLSDIETCDFYSLEHMRLEDFDYLFTTVPLEKEMPIPVLYTPVNMNHSYIRQLQDEFESEQTAESSFGLSEMFRPDLFLGSADLKTKDEVIRFMVDAISRAVTLPANFYNQVKAREARFPTEMGNQIAFPHPLKSDTNCSFVSMLVLKKAIRWDREHVRIICMGAIRKCDSKRLQPFYEQLPSFLSNPEYRVRLIDKPVYATLKEIIKEIRKEH